MGEGLSSDFAGFSAIRGSFHPVSPDEVLKSSFFSDRSPRSQQPVALEAFDRNIELPTVSELVDHVNRQLNKFERGFPAMDADGLSAAMKYFSGQVELVDAVYQQVATINTEEFISMQSDTIRSLTVLREYRDKVASVLVDAIPDCASQLEFYLDLVANSDDLDKQLEESVSQSPMFPLLNVLFEEYRSLAKSVSRKTRRFEALQDSLSAYRNLRFWARLRVSQTYERLNLIDQAKCLKADASLLGMGASLLDNYELADVGVHAPHQRFLEMYQKLLAFKEKHGHCEVPRRFSDDKALAIWVANTRARFKRGKVFGIRLYMLNKIGFCWTSSSKTWQGMFKELEAFIAKSGHSMVPPNYPDSPELSNWVRNLRKECRRGRVSQSKIAQLKKIGFAFEVRDLSWLQRLEELRLFKSRFGHCRVTHQWAENARLASWVSTQRDKMRNDSLSQERAFLLNSLGFDWSPPIGRPKVDRITTQECLLESESG